MNKLIIIVLSLLFSTTLYSKDLKENYREYIGLKTLIIMIEESNIYDEKSVCLGNMQLKKMHNYLDNNLELFISLPNKEKDDLKLKTSQYKAMVLSYRTGNTNPKYCL